MYVPNLPNYISCTADSCIIPSSKQSDQTSLGKQCFPLLSLPKDFVYCAFPCFQIILTEVYTGKNYHYNHTIHTTMSDSYPYMISNNKIGPIFGQIKIAAKPKKFSHTLLKQMGFSSSNDRAIIPLLKGLGFLTEDGVPTEYYDRLKDSNDHPFVIGERITNLYKDLYAINTEMHDASETAIKGAIARVTGKDSKTVARYFATFKALTKEAEFGSSPKLTKPETPKAEIENKQVKKPISPAGDNISMSFQHNIEIHLPATTDVSVYNAIFKSIRENLLE